MEEWVNYSEKISRLLDLEKMPVSVCFTNEKPEGIDPGHASFCQAIKLAAQGQVFLIDKEHSVCPGGTWHCGLSKPPEGQSKRAIQKFLTSGEKLTASIVSFHRMSSLAAPPPTDLSEYVYICPLEKSVIKPDLAVLICNPEQACRLITLDIYWDGVPPKIELAGSLCHSVIAYPVTTGNTNLSFGDWTARRMQGFEKEDVFLSIPFERMKNLMEAIPRCSAGTASFTGFEEPNA